MRAIFSSSFLFFVTNLIEGFDISNVMSLLLSKFERKDIDRNKKMRF